MDKGASEAVFTKAVIDLARWLGWRVVWFRAARTQSGGWATPLSGDRGSPDLLLARKGVVILAELKSEKGRLGPGQREWGEALGPHYRLWRPSDMNKIKEELR